MTERSAARPGADAGGGSDRATPSSRPWRVRLDDPSEPLFTMAVAADLLGLDTQALRRLSTVIDQDEARPSGNQRRYSRNDLDRLDRALQLVADGHSGQSIATILDLTDEVDTVRRRGRAS